MTITSGPVASQSTDELTDWLEHEALRRRRASMDDLISALRTSGTIDGLDTDVSEDPGGDEVERLAESALGMASRREAWCRGGYPFEVKGQALVARSRIRYSTYSFLMLLSRHGKDAGPTGTNGAKLFESVATHAARGYLGTTAMAYNFGFPRSLHPSGFVDALSDLCAQLGEGVRARNKTLDRIKKDGKLDLVAWVPMVDGRASKVIAFGQCAVGRNWAEKLQELQPASFGKKFLQPQLAVDPIRMFFVPHILGDDAWHDHCTDAGIIFDRLRVATYALTLPSALREDVRAWTQHVLSQYGKA